MSLSESLASFTAETRLQPEHRRLMDAHHRVVEWDASTAAEVPEALRPALAELWRSRMVAEHRSIGIFSLYTLDLLGAGAPAEVVSLACRASLDEVRHTELFTRLTELYSGQREAPPGGIPPMPDDPSVPIRFQVAREALHLCVCSESFSTASLSELHARSSDPAVKGALANVIADEIHHARMGWVLLSRMLAEPDSGELRARLQAELIPMFDGFARDLFGDPKEIPEPSLKGEDRRIAEAHGYIPLRDEYEIFRSVAEEVWVPGLAGLGLSSGDLRGRYPKL
ncbi:MAG: hypothetical protein U0414_10005 [Polyangiaceae bacterium]